MARIALAKAIKDRGGELFHILHNNCVQNALTAVNPALRPEQRIHSDVPGDATVKLANKGLLGAPVHFTRSDLTGGGLITPR
jgi:hypothetical protein